MNEFYEILLDAALDSLKLLPFLFATYLIIELIEHRASHGLSSALSRFGKAGPLIGAAAGLVPQCGFSVTAANLCCGNIISFGTLLAVFSATSDEAVPVLLSHPGGAEVIPKLLAVKFLAAALCGIIADLFVKRPVPDESAHESLHNGCRGDCCRGGIAATALKHSLRSFAFIFVTMALLEAAVSLVGERAIADFVSSGGGFQPLIAVAVGFIPGCASSIILSELFVGGALGFPSLAAGLTVNTGIGLLFLFKRSRDFGRCLLCVFILTLTALLTSAAAGLLGL